MYNYEIFQEGLQIADKKGYKGNYAFILAEAYSEGYVLSVYDKKLVSYKNF